METKIRTLQTNEIDCRVGSVNDKGFSILLYKDARVDMKILDEVYGSKNWQRTHEVINNNLFCNIEIWDDTKKCWVKKQDVGTESMTEKEKGEASDSFKRAGFNWGIGRELYTAPFIWINGYEKYIEMKENGKYAVKNSLKLHVSKIEYNTEKEITKLEIKDNYSKVAFTYGLKSEEEKSTKKIEDIKYRDLLVVYIQDKNMDFNEIAKQYKLNAKTSNDRFKEVLEHIQKGNK